MHIQKNLITDSYNEPTPQNPINFDPGWKVIKNEENRTHPFLRAVAKTKDPMLMLKLSAELFYCIRHPDKLEDVIKPFFEIPFFGTSLSRLFIVGLNQTQGGIMQAAEAVADLSVSGRNAYAKFKNIRPTRDSIYKLVKKELRNANDNEIYLAVDMALDRSYKVSWALRDNDAARRSRARISLGWVTVSGEDDSPDRPINVTSAPFPQYDITVKARGKTIQTRFMVASLQSKTTTAKPARANALPEDNDRPTIPATDKIIIFIHGHSSRLEESLDIAGPLMEIGKKKGHKYSVIAFDFPSCGYTSMIDENRFPKPKFDLKFDPLPTTGTTTWPMLDFFDQFFIAFVNELDRKFKIKNRIVAVIGGSLGGNVSLRLAERNDLPWLKNIVSWSPASVWNTLNDADLLHRKALKTTEENMNDKKPDFRKKYFEDVFDKPIVPFLLPAQPETWYRGKWPFKKMYIHDARTERQEIYNEDFRRMHYRIALEQLLFSHNLSNTPDKKPWYTHIHKNTFLAAGDEDNYTGAHIYSRTKDLAENLEKNHTSGEALFFKTTGHSIDNERPILFAHKIVDFLTHISSR